MRDLNAALLAAHDRGDHRALVDLYQDAATQAPTQDERCFFLTQAYVFALEQNHPAAQALHDALAALHRV